jgi:hypothetical protein
LSNAAVQAYRVIALRGDAGDFSFFMEVLAVWEGFFVEDVKKKAEKPKNTLVSPASAS